jgi:hypothetical protein
LFCRKAVGVTVDPQQREANRKEEANVANEINPGKYGSDRCFGRHVTQAKPIANFHPNAVVDTGFKLLTSC